MPAKGKKRVLENPEDSPGTPEKKIKTGRSAKPTENIVNGKVNGNSNNKPSTSSKEAKNKASSINKETVKSKATSSKNGSKILKKENGTLKKATKNNELNDEPEIPKVKITHKSHGSVNVKGVVLTLGEGDVGQLGLGEDIMEKSRPAFVTIPDPIIQVTAGGMHTVCLTEKGTIYTFGCNDEGGLGRDTSVEGTETVPEKVDLPHKIVQVSAGDSHTAALTEYGKVYAWGNFRDANGSIGLTKSGIEKIPTPFLEDEVIIKIASGVDHLVCLTQQGVLYTLGCAEQGQLGRLAECFTNRGGRKGLENLLKPSIVRCKKYKSRRLVKFSDVWTGQYVTFAEEKDSGDIYGWGLNNYYQLGFADMENRFSPERITSFCQGIKWEMISGGQHHTIALDSHGKVYSLGRADYGRLGLGEKCGEKSEPTLVPVLEKVKCNHVDAGGCASFAVDDQGDIYAWGMGTSKQLGNGSEDDLFVPEKMAGKQLSIRKCMSVSSGGQHTVLLAQDTADKNS